VGAEGKMSQVRREEIRKVAAMVKRLKKNTEENTADPGQECTVVVGSEEATGNGWSVQQQDTVAAYALARGMEPREVLQALVSSMEKSLHKKWSLVLEGGPSYQKGNKSTGQPISQGKKFPRRTSVSHGTKGREQDLFRRLGGRRNQRRTSRRRTEDG
jgi:hypothetical protein